MDLFVVDSVVSDATGCGSDRFGSYRLDPTVSDSAALHSALSDLTSNALFSNSVVLIEPDLGCGS